MNQSLEKQIMQDGLHTPEIGSWSIRKHELVQAYSQIFATSMKYKWDCRVYIDLFASAGLAKIKNSSRLVHTSSILAINIPDRFDYYIFCDQNKSAITSLEKRIYSLYQHVNANFIDGDSNKSVKEILGAMPKASYKNKVLTFCFVDPFKIKNLHFSTIEKLSEKYMDFLVLIPTNMDAKRNISYYETPNNKAIENFTGNSEWRVQWEKVKLHEGFDIFLTNLFGQSMEELGYYYTGIHDTQLIKSSQKNLPLYRLVFFSRNKLGKKFWKEVKKRCNPQQSLF